MKRLWPFALMFVVVLLLGSCGTKYYNPLSPAPPDTVVVGDDDCEDDD